MSADVSVGIATPLRAAATDRRIRAILALRPVGDFPAAVAAQMAKLAEMSPAAIHRRWHIGAAVSRHDLDDRALPNGPGSRFDMDYYVNRHLKLVRDRLEPMGMRAMTIATEATLDPAAGPQAYRLMADLRFDDMEATRKALTAHGPETQADTFPASLMYRR